MGTTIEGWALREGVRQVQKACGKAIQWCDAQGGIGALTDFDEADAEFWLMWAQGVQDCAEAVVGITDRLMAPPELPACPAEACERGDKHEGPCKWNIDPAEPIPR